MWNKNQETVTIQSARVQKQNSVGFPQNPIFSIAEDFLNTISIKKKPNNENPTN